MTNSSFDDVNLPVIEEIKVLPIQSFLSLPWFRAFSNPFSSAL